MSKIFTAAAVTQLVEQGKLDLDVDVNRYLEPLGEHLVEVASGMPFETYVEKNILYFWNILGYRL